MCIPISIYIKLFSKFVGQDKYGNSYFLDHKMTKFLGRCRRWVIYDNNSHNTVISAEWISWLHHQSDSPKNESRLASTTKYWEKDMAPNFTGTTAAYTPNKYPSNSQNLITNSKVWRPQQ